MVNCMGKIKIEKLRDLHPELAGKLQNIIKDQIVKVSCAKCKKPLRRFQFRHWREYQYQTCKNSKCEDKNNQIDVSKIKELVRQIGLM